VSDIPDEFIPDEHIQLGEGGHRLDVNVEKFDNGPGGYVEGLCPPFYDPVVIPVDEGVYKVERGGCPTEHVRVNPYECSCRQYQDHKSWCIHLIAVRLYCSRVDSEEVSR